MISEDASNMQQLSLLLQASCLSQGMKYQFATGNWGQDIVLRCLTLVGHGALVIFSECHKAARLQ